MGRSDSVFLSSAPRGEGKLKEQRQACKGLVPNHPLVIFKRVVPCVLLGGSLVSVRVETTRSPVKGQF